MAGFSVSKKGRSFIRGKTIDYVRESIIDSIIAEGGDPVSGYFTGQFKEERSTTDHEN